MINLELRIELHTKKNFGVELATYRNEICSFEMGGQVALID